MLSKVSWGEFLTGAGILLAIYYLVIGVGYFRQDVISFISKIQKRGGSAKENHERDSDKQANAVSSMEELEDAVADLHDIMKKAGNPADKPELLRQISQRLAVYPGLSLPVYRVAINNYIIQHAGDVCDITFTEHELNDTWDSLSR